MIKLDIINRVADRTGVPKMKAEQAVDALFHSMKEALTRGERIELEEVAIPSGKTIRFKPGKELQGHEDGAASGGDVGAGATGSES